MNFRLTEITLQKTLSCLLVSQKNEYNITPGCARLSLPQTAAEARVLRVHVFARVRSHHDFPKLRAGCSNSCSGRVERRCCHLLVGMTTQERWGLPIGVNVPLSLHLPCMTARSAFPQSSRDQSTSHRIVARGPPLFRLLSCLV